MDHPASPERFFLAGTVTYVHNMCTIVVQYHDMYAIFKDTYFDFVFQQHIVFKEEEQVIVFTVPDLIAKIVNAKASRRRLVRAAVSKRSLFLEKIISIHFFVHRWQDHGAK